MHSDQPVFLSFFSGALGLDMGLEQAGFQTRFACEINDDARATIAANRPHLPLADDVTRLTPSAVRYFQMLGRSD